MNKDRLRALVFILVTFLLGCNEFMVVGILSEIARHLHVSLTLVGDLVTVFAVVYAISTPLITIFTSKYNRYQTLLVLMAIFLIGNTITAMAPNYFWMLLSRMIAASVAGAIISFLMTFTAVIVPKEKRASLVAWVFAGYSIASVFGVPIGTMISIQSSWRNAFMLVSMLTVIAYGLLIWLLPKHVMQATGTFSDQMKLLRDRRIQIGILLALFTAATMYGYYTYIRPLLTSGLGFHRSDLNLLLFAIGLMSIASNRWSGHLAKHGGLNQLPKYYLADLVILMLLPEALNSQVFGFGALLILTMIVTLLSAPLQVYFLSIAETDYPQALLLASSLSSIFFNYGISLGSATASIMFDVIGLRDISFGAAIYSLISLLLILGLNRIIRNQTTP
ncbi:MFS transporter [Lactobacillus sp. LC28-10]|uniref:MFS transporter n=1 Tax=Secundilactobacillus angelensis TaxID=2722706 RepID=A0ABX1KXR1_9LACO|nr:MFS transporter [Secundilactobacillus angelensis]MCH5461186.1 MFS transporter [Secundilactobacillus angelensis]NLR17618.1 MFS transporter [Secundilactobacillus angelensis]